MSRRGWLLFGTMSVIWGLPYLLIRVAVRHMDPGVLVFCRTAPVGVFLLLVLLFRGQLRTVIDNARWIVIFGVVEFGIPWFLMSTSERHITSSLTSLIICAVPLFSIVAQRFRRTEEHVTRRRLLGLGIGAAGVALLVGLGVSGGSFTWVGFMLLVCVGYAVGPLILAAKLQHVPSIAVVAGATFSVAVLWSPWALTHWPHAATAETWASAATLSVVCTAGAFFVFFELVREVGATRSVVVTYLNTAIAVVLGITFLREPLTAAILAGFPLVLVGSVLATTSGTRRESVGLEVA
ncbi:MAG TPA: DMT family transporter [Acidimicrobiales bacterium]|nr:DMT family transporter [Acidimicrobiales bacterium]